MERIFRLLETPLVWLSGYAATRRINVQDTPSAETIGHSISGFNLGRAISIPPKALEKHLYILGSTGCGKTNFIMRLLEQDLARGQSVVIVDLRGDLIQRALSLCVSQGVSPDRVTLLDLREKDSIVGFNPLSGAGEPFVRALHLQELIRHESDSWGIQLDETLRNCLLLLAHGNKPITDLETLLFDHAYINDLCARCEDSSVVSFFDRYVALPEDKQLSWALPVLNKVTPLLATPRLRALLGAEKSLDLSQVLSTPGSVFLVSLAIDEFHGAARLIGSLVVSAITREMLSRVDTPEDKRNPVRLYVDEFEAMATDSFEGLIAEGRRFKLSLVLSHQNLHQLPTKLRSVIRNNVGLQALFGCGSQDARELKSELPEDVTPEQLANFGVGEMLLMPRAGESNLVKCCLSTNQVSPSKTVELRRSIFRRIGTPFEDVLNGIYNRKNPSILIHSLQQPWGLGGGLCE